MQGRMDRLLRMELLEQKENALCCKYAYLSAVIRGCADLSLTRNGFAISIQSTEALFVEYTRDIIAKLIGESMPIEKSYIEKGYQRGDFYTLLVPVEYSTKLLSDCEILINKTELVETLPSFLKECCIKAYLKGLFLSCGTLTTPSELDLNSEIGTIGKTRSGYHLEFAPNTVTLREQIRQLLVSHAMVDDKSVRIRDDKKTGIYVKDSNVICNILASMGCSDSVVELQQIMASRDMKNEMNRCQNFELANMDKSSIASANQINAILYLAENYGLDKLPAPLRYVCLLRLDNGEVNLQQLAEMASPPLTKSGINHRMRKIMQMANELKAEIEGEE